MALRVAGAQINLVVGDLEGNEQRILESMDWAESASADVRAIAQQWVGNLAALTMPTGGGTGTPSREWSAHIDAMRAMVKRYQERPFSPYTPQKPLPVPAGDPIGGM